MRDNEIFNKFLEEGETVRWSAAPQPYGLFDETHKTSTLISLCWALAWGIFLVGGYYWLSVSQGQEIRKGIMAFCAVIPLMLAWGPVTDKNNVKKLRYAVTDKKIIVVYSDTDKAFTMNTADVDELRFEKTVNGNCHLRLGSPVFKVSARKLTGLAFRGEFDTEGNDKIYKGLVFYNLSAEDGNAIHTLLKPLIGGGK